MEGAKEPGHLPPGEAMLAGGGEGDLRMLRRITVMELVPGDPLPGGLLRRLIGGGVVDHRSERRKAPT